MVRFTRHSLGFASWVAAAGMVAAVLTSCSMRAPATSSAANAAAINNASPAVAKLYAGDYGPPPATGPKAQRGKNVWFVSCGQAFDACSGAATAFQEAGRILGWNVTVVDSKASPQTANGLINQAVAAGADGIAVIAFDCPTIRSGLLAAKAANIPTVNFGGLDCDYPGFGGGSGLFTKTENDLGGASWENYAAAYQRARVTTLLGYAPPNPTILNLAEKSSANHDINTKAFLAALNEQCPKCTVIPVEWTFAQVPATATQIWKAAIQSHPEASVLSNDTDSVAPLGLNTAIQQSGRRDLVVIGAEGFPANLSMIRSGVQTAALAIQPGYTWQMYGLADTLNRLFANATDFPDEGGGWVLVDKTHNLPDEGAPLAVPDFAGKFKTLWAGQ
ncbi:substrate-binding domain-containing protein [Amycolatopsis sp. GM8]|uniref:sugar ABC transporter substrate-binding protein n=1 Tax=Amycolatopsis sp. GM8 TaxID=2896530 RepID=UPI001F2D62E3|nr:substrate-binding domain-containing protein [Amycolatopsis sp. GM8]